MFRQFVLSVPALRRITTIPRVATSYKTIFTCRSFSASSIAQKKAKKGGKVVQESTAEPIASIDYDQVNKKLQSVVDLFTKYANEAKLGKANPKVFDNLLIETEHGEMPYTSVAQTNVKGRNLILTVYDPANVQKIINAVLGSDLNLNPVADPNNKLTLKVPLPPITTEVKKEAIKDLKAVYEKLRNGTGSGKTGSLSSIRNDTRHKFSKNKKLDDNETKLWNEYEKNHKSYVDKLASLMKNAETQIMQ